MESIEAQLADQRARLQSLRGAGLGHKATRVQIRQRIQELEAGIGATAAGGGAAAMAKYPSTPHLPFSPQVHSDDVQLGAEQCAGFFVPGVEVQLLLSVPGCFH